MDDNRGDKMFGCELVGLKNNEYVANLEGHRENLASQKYSWK